MHQKRRRVAILGSFVVALILAAGMAVSMSGGASAQAMVMGAGHPAHVHTGLCPAPGAVVYPLTDVSSADAANGTPMAATSMVGASSAIGVETSTTKIAVALSAIADGTHSIVVHESAANIGNYLVCGDIGGTMMGTTDLAIGLGTLNNSGYTGVATLHDNGDGTTNVTIFLVGGAASSATPVATPAS